MPESVSGSSQGESGVTDEMVAIAARAIRNELPAAYRPNSTDAPDGWAYKTARKALEAALPARPDKWERIRQALWRRDKAAYEGGTGDARAADRAFVEAVRAVLGERASSVSPDENAVEAKIDNAVAALLSGERVSVRTTSREFEGRVWELGRSPFDGYLRARVVEDDGRVHYFKVDKADASVSNSVSDSHAQSRDSAVSPDQPETSE